MEATTERRRKAVDLLKSQKRGRTPNTKVTAYLSRHSRHYRATAESSQVFERERMVRRILCAGVLLCWRGD
jgi:hypothetical protein